MRTFKELPTDGRERNARFDIESRTSSIRSRIEACHSQSPTGSLSDAFVNLYNATMPYKCPKPWCDDFLHGFKNLHDRKSHVDRHVLPFACPKLECFAFHLGYENQSKLDDHIKRHHPKPTAAFEFPQQTPKKPPNILAAVKRGQGATVISMLDSMRNSHLDAVNATHGRNRTNLLYEAVKNKHFDLCKSLLERGAHTNYHDYGGNSALYIAAQNGSTDIVRLLLSQSNCEPDRSNHEGWSPAYTACVFGHLEIVKLLFGKGGVNRHHLGRTMLGSLPQHQILTKPWVTLAFLTLFEQACLSNSIPLVQYLLQETGFTIRPEVFDAIFWAGHQSMSELLSHACILESNSNNHAKHYREYNHVNVYHGWYTSFDKNVPRRKEIDRLVTIDITGNEERGYARFLRFSANGRYLAVLTADFARVYDSTTGEQLQKLELRHKDCLVRSLSSSGLYIATSSGGQIEVSFGRFKYLCRS